MPTKKIFFSAGSGCPSVHNPYKFYKAIFLQERNSEVYKEQAKQLLQEVVDEDLEGKSEAEEWLKKI